MVSEFKFFHKNKYKDRCKLEVGSSFIFKGNYCIVSRMYTNSFEFIIQGTDVIGDMSYIFYLTTPSAVGRKLNR